jgi:hypothetical protein
MCSGITISDFVAFGITATGVSVTPCFSTTVSNGWPRADR